MVVTISCEYSVDPETDQENADEFPGVLWSICGNLSKNQNFDSADLAVQSAISCVVEENGTLLQTSAEKAKEVRGDVIKIVRGPGNGLPGMLPVQFQRVFSHKQISMSVMVTKLFRL